MSDIDYHYETMGRILAHLVNRGLARVDFEPNHAMEIMTEPYGDEDEVLQPSPTFCTGCLPKG